jgi:hypothetical protein
MPEIPNQQSGTIDDRVSGSPKHWMDNPDDPLTKYLVSPLHDAVSVGYKAVGAATGAALLGYSLPAIALLTGGAALAAYAMKKAGDYALVKGYYPAAGKLVTSTWDNIKALIREPFKATVESADYVMDTVTGRRSQPSAQPG